MNDFLYAVWFFLPAGMANVTPILAARIPLLKNWAFPLDFNLYFRKKRIFGINKTWRGVVTGTLVAMIVFLLQQKLSSHLGDFSVYLSASGYPDFPVILGFLLGIGALFGDAFESFLKRQFGILPGSTWPPFDQLDYIIGASLCAAIIVILPITVYIWIFVIWSIIHLIFSYIGYRLGLKKTAI